jgi:hypothetical protein
MPSLDMTMTTEELPTVLDRAMANDSESCARDGSVRGLIPDPVEKATGTSTSEGVAADPDGNIYSAEVELRAVKKYVRK